MSGKYIISKLNIKNKDFIFYGLHDGKKFYEVNFDDVSGTGILGNIYIGKVRDVVPGINAAFVEFQKNCIGYYSLENNKTHHFLNRKNSNTLAQGDEIIVQVNKDAVKSKDPVLTSAINLGGKFVALTIGKSGIGLSGKILSMERREELKNLLKPYESDNYGIIVRTNADTADSEEIIDELNSLLDKWRDIFEKAQTRTPLSVLLTNDTDYLKRIDGIYTNEIEEILTDDCDIYNEICDRFPDNNVRLYKDDLLPINKLYNIEGTIDEITSRKVWLNCGGYLVFDYTEAMTVIDVNSGKFSKGKNKEKSFLKINLEATEEIARQIRLRNISGIIIIDFINMEGPENIQKNVEKFKRLVAMDPIKTNVIDMTKLNLLEVTRKKNKPPIYEILC